MLVEYIDETKGHMLSETWPKQCDNAELRANLFRSLSRIILSTSRIPLARIGSFVVDNNGYLQLTNRPLTMELQDLENEGIPIDIQRNYTYSTVDFYVMDILNVHDSRIRHQPNAINNVGDYFFQTGMLTAMQTALPSMLNREFRRGPFVFTLMTCTRAIFLWVKIASYLLGGSRVGMLSTD